MPRPAVDAAPEQAGPFSPRPSDLLRIATAGSVDDGKSTLIGRLLFDSKQIYEDQLAHVVATSERRGDARVNLALLTDGLRAEREQGITIDVAYRYFQTPRRKFIIADTPGHQQYTRNMVTGASTADVAVILVDARHGLTDQSRRHAHIATLLGMSHLVLCINKMDLISYDQIRAHEIAAEFMTLVGAPEAPPVYWVPISALNGDNVVDRSDSMPWYDGPPLLSLLEQLEPRSNRGGDALRFPVQWVVRPQDDGHQDYRGYAGQLAGGTVRPGDEVLILPSAQRAWVTVVDSFDGPLASADAPLSVTLLLNEHLDISRGDLICSAAHPATVTSEFEATLCWMSSSPGRAGVRYLLKHTTRTVQAVIEEVSHLIDVRTFAQVPNAETVNLNDIAGVRIRCSEPLACDSYTVNRTTGSFILIDPATNETVAGGMIV
jgi:sulfate adenylyltransferase large subunit